MSTYHHFTRRVAALFAVAFLFVSAVPAIAATPLTDDAIGERLEAAHSMLASRAYDLTVAQRDALSNTLSDALETTHFGMQTSALRLLIEYADIVDFDRSTVFDVVRLYRDHHDVRVRRMAVVALGAMDDAWGINFLYRSLPYESSTPVKHTIAAVLAEATN